MILAIRVSADFRVYYRRATACLPAAASAACRQGNDMDPQTIFDIFKRNVTEHYFDMHGRVSREEFWYFILAGVIVSIAAAIVGSILHIYLLRSLVGLALLLPMAGLGARRLQDTGKDGTMVWIAIAPMVVIGLIGLLAMATGFVGAIGFLLFFLSIGWIINLAALAAVIYIGYLCAQPGVSGTNQYGPEPAKPSPKPATT